MCMESYLRLLLTACFLAADLFQIYILCPACWTDAYLIVHISHTN